MNNATSYIIYLKSLNLFHVLGVKCLLRSELGFAYSIQHEIVLCSWNNLFKQKQMFNNIDQKQPQTWSKLY